MLNVDSLYKSYDSKQVLNDVSFHVNPGEIIGLVGENGAGKSTLLKILATLHSVDEGSLTYNELRYGKDTQKLRQRIGYIPQEIAVWDEFTVEENMLFFEQLSWVKKSREQLRELCKSMKLDQWKEKTATLSGGMKRKLNIAISLIHDPELLLLDEPTAGIDLKSRTEIGQYLQSLAKNSGKTIIYTSHDMEEIISLCDHIYCIGQDPFYQELLEKHGKSIQVL